MRINYVSSKSYCWESYSPQRLTFEEMKKRNNIQIKWFNDIDSALKYPCDMIWLMGSNVIPTVKQNAQAIFVSFAMSDPACFRQVKFDNCSIYCTNSLEIFKKFKDNKKNKHVVYYDTSCNPDFQRDLNLKKETDIIVIATGKHPYVQDRIETVRRLRDDGFKIKVFGDKWNEHTDNHPFVTGEELIKELNKAHLMLDLTNSKAAHGRKILESSCCGTPVVTQKREEIENWFKEDEEIIYYKGYGDLLFTLLSFLSNKDSLREIGLKAREKCLTHHTTKNRIDKLLGDLNLCV